MSRKILLLPPLFLLVGSVFSCQSNESLDFWFWLFGFLFSCLIFLPVALSFDDKKVPVFQIFFLMILFLIFFARLAFWDFLSLGLKTHEALLYGLGISIGLLSAIMIIKGQKD